MDELKGRLQRIRDVLPPSTPVVYIDYPVHGNVGDLMIHAGADAFLEEYGYSVVSRYSVHDLTSTKEGRLRRCIHEIDLCIARGTAIVLHGGGNVGDIWPRHQQLREFLIRRYPDVRIVILPQSVHFNDRAARAKSAEVLRQHRGIHFFVRDQESLEFASSECDCPAEVLPDMAHQLWGCPKFTAQARPATRGTLVQRRRDKETAQPLQSGAFDWDDLRDVTDRIAQKVLVSWYRMEHPFRDVMPNWRSWYKLRDHRIRRAVERFSLYETIDTDRLHGMILGALLGKQIRFNDNCYGKLSRYYDLWMAQSDCIAPVRTTAEPAQSQVAQGQIVSQEPKLVRDPSELALR